MRILGVDPGTMVTGFGIVDDIRGKLFSVDYGTIEGKRKDSFQDRLKMMFDGLNKAIKDYKPDQVALESAFYGKSVKAAIKIGEARGVAILCAALADIPLFEYAPTEVKRAVVGIGNAQKVQVSKMVKILLALSEVPEKYDATDALAIAICHCHRMKLTI
ncbi:MAG: crossover junction endodeoxyribonuclease RuvC [Candidatus Scalindua sp.]|jgi:crossover junction endodeoxyribonuclease RuvC|nr:crossover junction endodeoxyribonuclease RuvC [Candidatus Scalindua sp.]MBT5305959.1 crossover junction endodeoxyribonuclease RuvC [Candidatus Scalindua sp.]MBT6564396.1 crossover junction endodeoxyribonuclease RuvC [Candidatus Scalindua sp.]MBT7212292.1 crossover junction endodeoxyribonuclease RuvC [Candidatus Scalindua sp.]MBT7590471.1 crossover junction endodeoxyribonuclease RuvC [Candidatus Scalindua sp.]